VQKLIPPPALPAEFPDTTQLFRAISNAAPPTPAAVLAMSVHEYAVPPLMPPPESFAALAVMTQFET